MMKTLPVVTLLCAALLTPGCVRECRCVVTVAPGADGCLVIGAEEAAGAQTNEPDEEALGALLDFGESALKVALGLIL